jgi:hypothetical protein
LLLLLGRYGILCFLLISLRKDTWEWLNWLWLLLCQGRKRKRRKFACLRMVYWLLSLVFPG